MATGTYTASNNDLAALGLDIGSLDTSDAAVDNALAPAKADEAVTPTPSSDTSAAPQTEGADVANKKGTRVQVKIAAVEIEDDVELTPLTRGRGPGGERASKYKFDEVPAPSRKEDGSFKRAAMLVTGEDGQDDEALTRSVQSAATQQNAKHKGKGEGFEGKDIRYVTRTVEKDGKFVGVRVYRVDGTLED